jgi:hypothetical protein
LGETHINAGGGFESTAAFVFLPHLSAYIGWGWNSFGSDDEYGGSPLHFVETGYTFGLQFIHPIGDRSLGYMIRAGGIANHIEMENDTEVVADTKHGLGWQVEGGFNVPIGERWSLRPSLRYRSLSRDATFGGITTPLDLRYLSLGMGVAWSW